MPLLRQQHAHHRDLLERATAETQTHANSAKDQDRHLMITERCSTPATTLNVRVGFQSTTLFHAPSRRCARSAKLKAQDCVTKTIRDPFTTHIPRGKIAHVAATFHHIDA